MHCDYQLSGWILIRRWSTDMTGLSVCIDWLGHWWESGNKLPVGSNNSDGTEALTFLMLNNRPIDEKVFRSILRKQCD